MSQVTSPSYPYPLENWWLDQIRTHYPDIDEADALHHIEKEVQKLSDLFTTDRPDTFKDYGDTPTRLLAYGLFFFPQSFVRAHFPVAELIHYRKWTPPSINKPLKILDIGSGLGAVGLSVTHFFKERSVALTAVDHSSESLNMLSQLHRDLKDEWPLSNLIAHYSKAEAFIAKQHSEKWDIITLGFSFNELTAKQSLEEKADCIRAIAKHLTPDGVLIILEPALRETSVALQHTNDSLIASGNFFSWGPYLSQASCPLLAEDKFWNHEVRNWQLPGSLERINRHLFRSVQELKFSYTILSKTPPPAFEPGPHHFRLVSPLRPIKGQFIAAGVATDGQKYTYNIQTRGLRKSEIKTIHRQYERGDILKVENLLPMKQAGVYRIQNFDSITEHFHF